MRIEAFQEQIYFWHKPLYTLVYSGNFIVQISRTDRVDLQRVRTFSENSRNHTVIGFPKVSRSSSIGCATFLRKFCTDLIFKAALYNLVETLATLKNEFAPPVQINFFWWRIMTSSPDSLISLSTAYSIRVGIWLCISKNLYTAVASSCDSAQFFETKSLSSPFLLSTSCVVPWKYVRKSLEISRKFRWNFTMVGKSSREFSEEFSLKEEPIEFRTDVNIRTSVVDASLPKRQFSPPQSYVTLTSTILPSFLSLLCYPWRQSLW